MYSVVIQDTLNVVLLYLISAKVQSRKFKVTISHIPKQNKNKKNKIYIYICNPCNADLSLYSEVASIYGFMVFEAEKQVIERERERERERESRKERKKKTNTDGRTNRNK